MRTKRRYKRAHRGSGPYSKAASKTIRKSDLKYRRQKKANMVGLKQSHTKLFNKLNENKFVMNEHFSNYVAAFKRTLPPNKTAQVIVMDSTERNSANELIAKGIPKNNIWIVEYNIKVANSHISAGFNTFNGNFEQFAAALSRESSDQKPNVCLGAYFDMCGTVTAQKKGILYTIQNLDNLTDGTMLAFTFAVTRIKPEDYEVLKAQFKQELAQLLLQKYNLRPEWTVSEEKLDNLCEIAKKRSVDMSRSVTPQSQQQFGGNIESNIDFYYSGYLCESIITSDMLMNSFTCICHNTFTQ